MEEYLAHEVNFFLEGWCLIAYLSVIFLEDNNLMGLHTGDIDILSAYMKTMNETSSSLQPFLASLINAKATLQIFLLYFCGLFFLY